MSYVATILAGRRRKRRSPAALAATSRRWRPVLETLERRLVLAAPVAVDDLYEVVEGQVLTVDDAPPGALFARRQENGHFYLVVNTAITAEQAMAEASTFRYRGAAGHLATMTDASENEFVRSLAAQSGSTYAIIGATDRVNEGAWSWVSGEPWDYTNWRPGEPNNSANEDYAEMDTRSGGWNDMRGNAVGYPRAYVVEFSGPFSGGVLDNDSDPDGDAMSVELVEDVSNGVLHLSQDGVFTYQPHDGFHGVESFTYRAFDGELLSSTATVTITVSPRRAPVAMDDSFFGREDATLFAAESTPSNISPIPWSINGHYYLFVNAQGISPSAAIAAATTYQWHGASGHLVTVADAAENEFVRSEVLASQSGTSIFLGLTDEGQNQIWQWVSGEAVGYGNWMLAEPTINQNEPYVVMDLTSGRWAGVGGGTRLNGFVVEFSGPFTGGVLDNDSDPDGGSITVSLVDDVQHGTLEFGSDGFFSYQPDNNFHGLDSFTYVADNGILASEPVTVTIVVEAVNDPPLALDDGIYELLEDTSLGIDPKDGVLANDSDVDSVDLTAVLMVDVSHGSLTLLPDGSFTYTPAIDFFGTDWFTYTAFDEQDHSPPATVTITVNNVHDAPVAVADEYAVLEDSVLVGGEFEIVEEPPEPPRGAIQWRIEDGGNGNYYYLAQAPGGLLWADARSAAEELGGHLVTITSAAEGTFLAANLPLLGAWMGGFQDRSSPSYIEPGGGWSWVTGEPWSYTNWRSGEPNNANDVEHFLEIYPADSRWNDIHDTQRGSFIVEFDSDALRLVNRGATWKYLDDGSDQGTAWHSPGFNDTGWQQGPAQLGYGDNDEATVVGFGPNSNNKYATTYFRHQFVVDDTRLLGQLSARLLRDDGAAVYLNGIEVFRDANLAPGAPFNAYTLVEGTENGEVSFSIDPEVLVNGVNTVAVEVHQVQPTSSDISFDFSLIATLLPEPIFPGVLANDFDVDGDQLVASLVTEPANGSITFNEDGSFQYVPHGDFFGTDTFSYQVADGTGLQSTPATVVITVSSVDDPPVASDDVYTIDEDATLTIDTASGVLSNDLDVDSPDLNVVLATDVEHGTLTLEPDGSFTYVPDADFFGTDSFTYRANDGQQDSDPATVTITINPIDDAPVAVADQYTVPEDRVLIVPSQRVFFTDFSSGVPVEFSGVTTLSPVGLFGGRGPVGNVFGGNFLRNSAAGIPQPVTRLTLTNLPPHSGVELNFLLALIDSWDGSLQSPPVGPDYFNVVVDGVPVFSEAMVTHAVPNTTYDPPPGALIFHDMDLGFGRPAHEAAYDMGRDPAFDRIEHTSDSLTIEWFASGAGWQGNQDESWAIDNVEVKLLNGDGHLLHNDIEVDGDVLITTLSSEPGNGTLTLNEDGSFEYTPNPNFVGTDTFTYQIDDGVGNTDSAVVSIIVLAVNDAPVAVDDEYVLVGNDRIAIEAEFGVLANDFDQEGQSLAARIVDQPDFGTLTLSPDGSFEYTPGTAFQLTDSFTYVVSDGSLDSNAAVVTILADIPTIEVGNHQVFPDAPNQIIDLYVSGSHEITGVNLRAQIGDGSGPRLEPVFQAVDFTGGIWDVAGTTSGGGPVAGVEQFVQANIQFTNAGQTTIADGRLVRLIVDTTGISSGTFDLLLKGTQIGVDTDLVGSPAHIVNGTITIGNSSVVGRHLFYNDSYFDGNDPDVNASDDLAIATDKRALLPGQAATFANYTSYSEGINGLIVDVAGLTGTPGLTDFTFKVGNDNDPANWEVAPAPSSITVRPGAGVEGSDRVSIVWPGKAIQKQWLQVTILSTGATGLASPDVFYFGNAVGDAGDSPTTVFVDGTDFVLVRDNPRTFLNRAPIDFPYDYNRDSFVDGFDLAVARDNGTNFVTALKLITVPGGTVPKPPQPRPAADGIAMLEPVKVGKDAVLKETTEEVEAVKRSSAVDLVFRSQLVRKDILSGTVGQRQQGGDSLEELLTLLAADWMAPVADQ